MPKPIKKVVRKGVLPRPAPKKVVVQKELPFESGLSLAEKLRQAERKAHGPSHVIVKARAGTGKTTTLVEGLKYLLGLPVSIEPSTQQAMVCDALIQSRGVKTIAVTSFGTEIVNNLRDLVPAGVEAMTTHAMGRKAIYNGLGRFEIPEKAEWVVRNRIAKLLDKDPNELWNNELDRMKMEAVRLLVKYCKVNLTANMEYPVNRTYAEAIEDISDDELYNLRSIYDIEVESDINEVFDLVRKTLLVCLDPTCDGQIDFDDMIWLPVALNLPIPKFDLLLVDEAQDLNRCQQALVVRAGHRLIMCGDDKQAIYAFAGADCYSLLRMEELLGKTTEGCIILPLTVTRRCGKAIVKEAQKLVPDFEAHEGNCEGKVSTAKFANSDTSDPTGTYILSVQSGDMIISRVNAPLVSQCFRLLKLGRKANIKGRNVAAGLVATVERLKAKDTVDLQHRLTDWYETEVAIEEDRAKPSESRLTTLRDKFECLQCFIENEPTRQVKNVIRKINSMFTDSDDKDSIRLCSIHAAKGLEAKRVWLLKCKGAEIPHRLAKTQQAIEQEWNLLYVGITRAIEELTYVA